jgi:hypothetical protein
MDRSNLLDPHKKIRWDTMYSIMTQIQDRYYPKSRQVKDFIDMMHGHFNNPMFSWDIPHEDLCYECLGTGLNQRTKADEEYLKKKPPIENRPQGYIVREGFAPPTSPPPKIVEG